MHDLNLILNPLINPCMNNCKIGELKGLQIWDLHVFVQIYFYSIGLHLKTMTLVFAETTSLITIQRNENECTTKFLKGELGERKDGKYSYKRLKMSNKLGLNQHNYPCMIQQSFNIQTNNTAII